MPDYREQATPNQHPDATPGYQFFQRNIKTNPNSQANRCANSHRSKETKADNTIFIPNTVNHSRFWFYFFHFFIAGKKSSPVKLL